jgi:PAS domain S-box-containing protein
MTSDPPALPPSPVLRITGAYLLFGAAWFSLSDRLVNLLVPSGVLRSDFRSLEGWLFVAATAALLGAVLHRWWGQASRAHGALVETREKFHTLLRHTPGMAYRAGLHPPWTMERLTPGCRALTGYPPEDLIGNRQVSFADLIHPEDRFHAWATIQQALGQGKPFFLDFRLTAESGEVKWVLASGEAVRAPGGQVTAIEGIVTDNTSHKKLEQQLLQAQKMEAVGQLAGGIAHDFNNLLTAISGYTELLLTQPQDPETAAENLREIQDASQRAATLTQQLLAFSRRQMLRPRVLDLNRVVENLERMLRRIIGETIEVKTRLGSDLGSIEADPAQIEQVILNLAVNARDAMPRGGRLRIDTGNLVLEEPHEAQGFVMPPGAYVLLQVADTGIGMDSRIQERIFEPFFSTKKRGRGTGLGLSTVYGIVKQSGAFIFVDSQPDQGTTFKIFFPAVEAAPDATEAEAPGMAELRGGETILVAEDDGAVRTLISRGLRRHGYTVLTAANGKDALRAYAAYEGPVHLLISDLVMPDMRGPELERRLRRRQPDLRILLISGYDDGAIPQEFGSGNGASFLQKPFGPNQLARAVRALLDGGGAPTATLGPRTADAGS